MAAPLRYWLAVLLSTLFLAALVVAAATTPVNGGGWLGWGVALAAAYVWAAQLLRRRRLLRVAKCVCYAGLAVSGVGVAAGVVGFVVRSTDLAMHGVSGLAFALISVVFLSGVHEASRRCETGD